MTDDEFLHDLQKSGVIAWEVFGTEGHFRIVGRDLILNDRFPKGVWSIFTRRYLIGIKAMREGLANEWHRLDWAAIEAEGKRLDEKFSDSPDC